jgi:hypothetical protein
MLSIPVVEIVVVAAGRADQLVTAGVRSIMPFTTKVNAPLSRSLRFRHTASAGIHWRAGTSSCRYCRWRCCPGSARSLCCRSCSRYVYDIHLLGQPVMSRIRGTRNRPAAGSSRRPGRAAGQGPRVRPQSVTGCSCAGRPRLHAIPLSSGIDLKLVRVRNSGV